MFGLLYLLIASSAGYGICKKCLPQLWKVNSVRNLTGTNIPLPKWMLIVPASFLAGTLVMSWFTYLSAFCFRNLASSLFYGNLASFFVFGIPLGWLTVCNRRKIRQYYKQFDKGSINRFYSNHRFEILFLMVITVFVTLLMFYSFYIENDTIHIGTAVFSDFGPHLSVIRSFSFGENFPTEYPHFPDGHARYHFLFQFLAGNLEFLGLPLDWAFNLPSILALVSMIMLLYALSVIILGNRWVGIVTTILFFFRSSFAFFTYLQKNSGSPIMAILTNDKFIGNTQHEDWGLWATPDVFTNQRHLAYALGIMFLLIIMVLPLFRKMVNRLNGCNFFSAPSRWFQEFFFHNDAWLPARLSRPFLGGVMLGLLSFWNGAVVLAALTVLFGLAIWSKHRLEHLIIAVIAIMLSWLETRFFMGDSLMSPHFTFGFLASQPTWSGVVKYYWELLGLLPIILIAGVFTLPHGARWLVIAFGLPFVLGNTLQLTPDIAVNHKYVLISVVLLNIVAAQLVYSLYHFSRADPDHGRDLQTDYLAESAVSVEEIHKSRPARVGWRLSAVRLLTFVATIGLTFFLTVTGFVDLLTFFNINSGSRSVMVKTLDPTLVWVKNNTASNDIFLTDTYCIHPILLAGRKIFYGWPYFAWSAGYDTELRKWVAARIYGSHSRSEVLELAQENRIRYVVVDDGIRKSREYEVNEKLFQTEFHSVFRNPENNLIIYKLY